MEAWNLPRLNLRSILKLLQTLIYVCGGKKKEINISLRPRKILIQKLCNLTRCMLSNSAFFFLDFENCQPCSYLQLTLLFFVSLASYESNMNDLL